MNAPAQRLIITIEDGLISGIYADGIDLSALPVFVIDYDTDGAGEDDGLQAVGDGEAFFGVHDIEAADEEMSRDMRRAYDTWACK